MKISRKLYLRYALIGLAGVGILIFLFSPALNWTLGAYFQRESALYAEPDAALLARVVLNDTAEVTDPPAMVHYTLDLNYRNDWDPGKEAMQVLREVRPLMLTVKTWSSGRNSFNDNPLIDVAEGTYDKIFSALFSALPDGGRDVYIRWNPDMEVPVEAYPWQQYPSAYIAAYRRFAEQCAEEAPRAVRMWAPAGYPGALEYYPGDDVVDAASVTLQYSAERNLDAYPRDDLPEQDAYRRVHRLRFLDAPIYVFAEPGAPVNGLDRTALREKLRSAPPGTYGELTSLREAEAALERTQRDSFTFGVYDPQARLLSDPNIGAEHLFTDFSQIRSGVFDSLFNNVQARGHTVIVSFEPFFGADEPMDSNVLVNVLNGMYDADIQSLYRTVNGAAHPVYLRYAHEMEIPIHRYPWQSQDPQTYIRSFRYVMDAPALSPKVRRVWGPAGDRGSLEWYPGDDYVDYVSIAIYGLPDKNITDPTQQEQFSRIFDRKMWRMRFLAKPVFITEFGVKGPEDYQTDWMIGAAEALRDDPRVVGINYFNMSDTPKAWGDIKPPDWSISPATLQSFLETLNAD